MRADYLKDRYFWVKNFLLYRANSQNGGFTGNNTN